MLEVGDLVKLDMKSVRFKQYEEYRDDLFLVELHRESEAVWVDGLPWYTSKVNSGYHNGGFMLVSKSS